MRTTIEFPGGKTIPGILLSILVGCSAQKTTRNNAPHALQHEFVIMAYSGPPPGETTLPRYEEIAGAGIEVLVPANGIMNAEQNLKAMDLAQKAGIKIIPVDMRVFQVGSNPDISVDPAVIRDIANDYKNHPALAGYVIRDEPGTGMFPALKDICELFRKEDPRHEPVINLLPSYGSPVQLGIDDFRAYIASFIATVKPGLLSYDNYALREGLTWYEPWYNDLAVVREETKKSGIPFIVFIQSEGISHGLRVPNRAEILWQVNTSLAYGAHGFGWFCYWTPESDQGFQQEGTPPPLVEAHYNAMIDIQGRRTEVYDFVREANFYLKKAGNELLLWNNTDVARYEAGKMIEPGSSPVITPSGDAANLVIGTFKKENRCRIVLSNSRCDIPSVFTIQVSREWKITGILTSIDALPTGDNSSLLQWSLAPGGSVILELQPERKTK
jgi:hypothetical protein